MKFLTFILLSFFAFGGSGIDQSDAKEVITFGPRETKIIGSIPYTVIGKYEAQFDAFEGRIVLDENLRQVESVYLEIEAGSIHSNSPWCDRVARSRRLLNAARYPKIIFRSAEIIHDNEGFRVKGVLEMHGIKRRMTFPFKIGIILDQKTKRKLFDLKGSWRINRKDFNIYWNRLLDRGGLVVGDYFTVDWGIKVHMNA